MRWLHRHVTFDALFMTDDTSIVHIGRLWVWLVHMASNPGSTTSIGNISSISAILPSADLSNSGGNDVLLGCNASALAIRRFNAAVLSGDSSVGKLAAFGHPGGESTSSVLTVDPRMQPDLDPVVMRGHNVEETPYHFRRLLNSKSCYGPIGLPIGCPKTRSDEGFELSHRAWRDAPLDDVQALALTPVTNKQVMSHLGRGKAAKYLKP